MSRTNKKNHLKASSSDSSSVSEKHSRADRILKIAAILTELAELMQQEGMGKEALHHLHQLQMRVRFAAPSASSPPQNIPTDPPAKWVDRTSREETPVDFIRREYFPWLGKGLTSAHIRRLDISLYEALKRWVRTNGPVPNFDLPTKKEMIDRRISEGTEFKIVYSPEQREKLRLYQALRRRSAKKDRP